jgi:hypothetical protein
MFVGSTVSKVRYQTPEEQEAHGWHRPAVVLELEDGGIIYASQDEEDNGPGTFFAVNKEGEDLYVFPEQEEG